MASTGSMTIPMRFRGHHWHATLEMAASMIIPTLVAIALLAAGVAGFHALGAAADDTSSRWPSTTTTPAACAQPT